MSVLTLILAGGQGSRLSILGEKRAKPAVPFAGKYRIIDFALSNAVNSGLYRVAVLTQYRPHSLMLHIGIGEPWDLNRAQPNGVRLWQPYRGRKDQDWYRGTADALYQNRSFIAEAGCDRLLILGGDHIYKQDYRDLLEFHDDKNADLTVAVMNVNQEEISRFGIMSVGSGQKITRFAEKPKQSDSTLASMGIYVFNTKFLLEQLEEDGHDKNSAHDFGKNIIFKGGLTIWEIQEYHIIYTKLGMNNISDTSSTRFELYFETDQLDAMWTRLSEAGVQIVHPLVEQPWGQRVFRVYDPDGHIVEMAEPMPAVILRFLSQGMSVEQIAQRTSMPPEMVGQIAAGPSR